MSVSISAVPFFLLFTISRGVIEYIQTSKESQESIKIKDNYNIHIDEETAEALNNKDFETNIMDKELLLKTLTEHGAVNIKTVEENISCDCEAFHLVFTKRTDKPYLMNISYNEEYKLEEFVENLGNEYTLNAQEISYNQIKERLEQQQLEIEEEEIYDDNTIVLTVNLE